MKTFEEVVAEASRIGVGLKVAINDRPSKLPEPESLFHLPLLTFCLLTVAHSRKGELLTVEMGNWIAAVLCETFAGLQPSLVTLEWSLPLRLRCADALIFAESAQLLTVSKDRIRAVELTERGRVFLSEATRNTSDLGLLARGLARSTSVVHSRGIGLL